MRIAESVITAYQQDVGELSVEYETWMSLETLGETLGSVHERRLPAKDAWGHPLRFRIGEGGHVLASDGPDGLPVLEPVRALWGDDIVLMGGKFLDPSMVTMSILRTLGTAIESYAVDHDAYPGPTNGVVPASTLEPLLVPVYILELPTSDAWGNPILVYGEPAGYLLLSLGADGKAETEYDPRKTGVWQKGAGATRTPGRDMLFTNGQFTQWPDHLAP
jgi:hypothetical protein